MQESISALGSYWGSLTTMYTSDLQGIRGAWLATTEPDDASLRALAGYRVPSVSAVIEQVVEAAFNERKGVNDSGDSGSPSRGGGRA
jgi:hypothetical protein